MFKLRSEAQFDMAHYLSGYKGKCANIHGHRYRLIATLKAEELHKEGQCRGMVDDFTNFKNALRDIAESFDDNEDGRALAKQLEVLPNNFNIVFVPYRSTAEEMSRDIFNKLKAQGFPIYEVELFETPTNSCIYSEE